MKDLLIEQLIKCIHYKEWNVKIAEIQLPNFQKMINLKPGWLDAKEKQENPDFSLMLEVIEEPQGADRVDYRFIIEKRNKKVESLSEVLDEIEAYFQLGD